MGKCIVENCENECFEQEDKCILHCEKDDWYKIIDNKKDWSKSTENIKLFWDGIRNVINGKILYAPVYSAISLNNIIFSEFEEKGLADIYNYENAFCEKTKEKKFTEFINFNDCTFLDCADFTSINFGKDIVFSKCIFKDEIKFKKQLNIRISFLECPEIESLDFSRIIFEQKVEIKECVINSCNFEYTRFKDFCDFEKTTFAKIIFNNTVFEKLVTFQKTKFTNDIDFRYVTFKTHSIFKNTIFQKTVNFENTLFEVDGSFYGISSKEDKIEDIIVANRETARIIKNSFEQQNNIIEANKFYTLEMKEREKELSKTINKKNIIDLIIFKLHGLSSNHSQDPVLPVLWILNIAFIYSMFISTYYHNNALAYIAVGISSIGIARSVLIKNNIFLKVVLFINLLISSFLSFVTFTTIADKINPFSIVQSNDPITFGLLMFKVTIAYLIYQFIVSVRQNTRRK